MVDFPDGYGFAPYQRRYLMQDKFLVDLVIFFRTKNPTWRNGSRRVYDFDVIGFIHKEGADSPVRGVLYPTPHSEAVGPPVPVEGSIQQVVTALCTIHRMTRRG